MLLKFDILSVNAIGPSATHILLIQIVFVHSLQSLITKRNCITVDQIVSMSSRCPEQKYQNCKKNRGGAIEEMILFGRMFAEILLCF